MCFIKKTSILLISALLVSASFPMYAKTENTITNKLPWDKVIEKSEKFNVNLEMDFEDTLPIGETNVFFLSGYDFDFDSSQYEDTKITTQSGITVIKDKNIIVNAEIDKYSSNYMRVEITNTGSNDIKISIPIKGIVSHSNNNLCILIDSDNKYVTPGEYYFKEIEPIKIILRTGQYEEPTLISKENNKLSAFWIEEYYAEAIKELTNEDRIINIKLNHDGYKFTGQNILMIGKRGLEEFEQEIPINIIDSNNIQIELPKIGSDARGNLLISNLQIESVSNGIYSPGDISIIISGNRLETNEIVVAKSIATENSNTDNSDSTGSSNSSNNNSPATTVAKRDNVLSNTLLESKLIEAIKEFKKPLSDDEKIIPTNLNKDKWSYDAVVFATTKGLIDQDKDGNVNLEQLVTRANLVQVLGRLFKIEAAEAIYSDIDIESEYSGYLEELNNLGIIQGLGDNTFDPNTVLSREQAATILIRLIENINGTAIDISSETMKFKDEDISSWAMDSIIKANKLGIIKGVGNDIFNPKDDITFEQLLVIIERMRAIL